MDPGVRSVGACLFPIPDELAMGSALGVVEPELADAPLPFTRLEDALRPSRPITPACGSGKNYFSNTVLY